MTTAFVLSGGGNLGAIQVGMLQALSQRGIHPDLLVGTSIGAMNAIYVAGYGTGRQALRDLARIWTGLRRREVFPVDPLRQLRALTGTGPSLFANHGLRRLLARHLTFTDLEAATIPVHVVATNVLSGTEVLLSSGDALSAVLASTAIPAVFPTVERDGLMLVDGGLADNTAISQALALGADRVFVLPTGHACALDRPPDNALAAALHALTLLIAGRLVLEVTQLADRADIKVDINVLPPLCPLSLSPVDFGHAGELIDRARDASGKWLDAGGHRLPHPERFLSLHHHPKQSHPRADGSACPVPDSRPVQGLAT